MAAPFLQRTSVRIVGALLVAAATTAAWTLLGPVLVPTLNRWLHVFGPYVSIGFVLVGALVIALCAPASLLYVTAGMIFGVWRGLLLGVCAAVLGSTLAFVIARTVFGQRVARVFARSARLDRFEHALSNHGLWLVTLLRLSLIAPIGPVSYALGVMRISFKTFLLAMPAVAPSILVYVYAGHVARGLVNGRGSREAWEWIVLGLGFAATALVTVWVGREAHRALSSPRAAAQGS
jgi:uncharacterized membrane protein YdjX (TVP38/TMEM64 family)